MPFFLSTGAEADGTRWYVTQNGGTVTKDGTSWATAYGEAEFPAAIQSAQDGDEIWVAEGIYRPVIPADTTNITADEKSATFQLKSGVALYGGFTGDETTRDARDWENNLTVLTGDLAGDDTKAALNGGVTVSADYIVGTNSGTVVIGSGTDDTAVLDGFTLCGGNQGTFGGGMYNDAGSPTVSNCTFSGNKANDSGGGIFNDNGSPTVTDCTFSGNNSSYGGGMVNSAGSPTVSNCTFSQNNADSNGGGGGMYNYYSSPTVTNCTFSQNNNNADSDGGGMFNEFSSPTVTNCTFSGNNASNGGGMFNQQSSPTVTNCTFSGNNSGYGYGGGMFNNSSSSPTVTNCTFSGNNSGYAYGGGMYNAYSSPTVTNCIFWEDTAATGNEIYNSSATPTVTYCVVEGGYAGDGNLGTNPFLGPLQDNGGPTKTRALGTNSSAIGNGTSAGIWQSISLDQRGVPRKENHLDRGAYESSRKILTVDTEGSGNVTCTPEGTSFGTRENQWYYDAGNTSVTLEASSNSPWVLTEWSGDVSGTTTTATITMDVDRRVRAIFTRQWNILASAGTGGTIAPSGNITVAPGSDQTFTVTPEEGYAIEDVRVDGTSQGAVTSYTFTNVTEDHTMAVSFAAKPTSGPGPSDPTATPIPPEPTTTTTPAPSGTPAPTFSPRPLQGDIKPGVTVTPVPNEEDPAVRELKEELDDPESDARKALESTIREQVQAALEEKLGRKIDLENMQVNVHTSDAYRFEEVPLNKDDGTGTVIVPVEITYRESEEEKVEIFFTLVLVYDLATNPPTPLEYRVVMLEEGRILP